MSTVSVYRVGEQSIASGDPDFQHSLARAYEARVRPLCLCKSPAVPMYVARFRGRYLIKRMPGSGEAHDAGCDSFELPPALSGLNELVGSAIQEDLTQGITLLKLDFPLAKRSARMAHGQPSEPVSVKRRGATLSLRALLHYLWSEAGFDRWTPAMAGKRSWPVINKYLTGALEGKFAKGVALADIVFIPEPFYLEKKEEIARRRTALMLRKNEKSSEARELKLFIAEVKEFSPAHHGHKMILKQVPDCPFMLGEAMHRRVVQRFSEDLALWDACDSSHLLAIGTFGIEPNGVVSVEEVALMPVTENWIPFESTFDKMLIDAMLREHRHFIKGLRYNVPQSCPLACLVATDAETPTAMYVVPADAEADYADRLEVLATQSGLQSWVWKSAEGMPGLPPKAQRQR